MSLRFAPGSRVEINGSERVFSIFRPMISATDGLSLGQILALTGLEGYTVQNWVKRGFVARPIAKKYHSRSLARILLISALRDSMKIDDIGSMMRLINGDTESESDDIISEEMLYDYFCEVVSDENAEIKEKVLEVTGDFESSDSKARAKLQSALEIMALAYRSARLKREADEKLENLKNF